MILALVEASGRVAQLVAPEEVFPVHPSLRWIEVPDDTTVECRFDGDTLVTPLAPEVP